jgi:uncharacterized membrane protein YeiH
MGPEHTLWLGTFQWHVHTLLYSAIGFLVFVLKVFFVSALQLQIRWTLPRFRYDQIMHLGWKVLLPAALINFIFTLILFICDPSLNGIMQWNAIGLCLFIVLTLRGPLTSKEVLNYENH